MSIALPARRFAGMVAKVNAFLLIAFLLVTAFLGLVAYKQGWFVHQSPIHFLTANALGISKGMPVKLHGFTIGSVNDMELKQGGVDVRLLIGSEYLSHIPQDSRAKHAHESGLIGASVIDILPGKAERAIEEGAQISFEPARGINDIIDDFRRQAIPAFNEVKNAMAHVGQTGEDVTQMLASLRKEVEQLPATHRAIRNLVEEATQATSELSKQATVTLHSVEKVSNTVDRTIPAVSEKLVSSLQSIDAAAVQARKTGEEVQLTLRAARPLVEHSEVAAREAGDVLGAAKRVWPLSDSFKETSDGLLPIDSFEAEGKGRSR
ncbi:MAG TPA: MlaD family protein [Burkholderiales bacterium]|nr:MlaD family protein [Burkholderiales bacterium]